MPKAIDRSAIVDTAEGLFRQFGFRKTVMADIAREMGMSPANIYRFFPSRDALCEAVCKKRLDHIEHDAQKLARIDGPAAARLRRLLLTIKQKHRALRHNSPLLFDLVCHAAGEKWLAIREHDQIIFDCLERIILDGTTAGEFRAADAGRAASLVKTACLQYLDPQLVTGHEAAQEPPFERMVNFCLAALKGKSCEEDDQPAIGVPAPFEAAE